MVEGKEVSNPDLKERYGVTLDGKSRLKLNDLKLVESRKQGRAFTHLLTDDGWVRVAEEIASGIPMPRGAAGAMNLALVTLVRGILAGTGQSLADLVLSASVPADSPAEPEAVLTEPDALLPAEPEAALPAESEAALPAGTGDGGGEGGGDVTERIRAAYAELAAEPGAWVGLVRLRPLLGDVPRAEVDRALKGMNRLTEVSIEPDHNQKLLTPEARAAAVTIGDQDMHLISIEAR
ncbi:hypothetical protein [Streptosporangium sp. NPDC051022]|uniref:hypothetical protein n=1 Tax=Streptosporangium sp. NPDC051022 TaxID=3155752 RepID=UPI00342E306F